MKKFLNLALLVGCIAFFSATTATAQNDYIKNVTACKILVKVGYGPIGSCSSTGYMQMISYPNTSVPMGIPAGTEIIIAKGTYISPPANCPFYVGLPCTIYPLIDNVACGSSCGNYTAEYFIGSGIKIY